jgi:hypothetical protein
MVLSNLLQQVWGFVSLGIDSHAVSIHFACREEAGS